MRASLRTLDRKLLPKSRQQVRRAMRRDEPGPELVLSELRTKEEEAKRHLIDRLKKGSIVEKKML